MVINLNITEDRNIYTLDELNDISTGVIGTTGEHNATVLRFGFFEKLNGELVSAFQKYLVAILPEGTLRYPIDGDFSVPEELTSASELVILIELEKNNEVLFKSYPHTFTFIESGDNPETNVIQIAVNSAKNEFSSELAESLEAATGEAQDGKTWDELNETVSALPVISDEQSQALGDYDLIKEYFATYKGAYHNLFISAPHNADSTERTYRLPYIYTPRMRWRNGNIISSKLLEYGVDVSCATALGVNSGVGPFSTETLQRLVLTGNANATHLRNFMTSAYELRYIKMETPSELVLKADPAYYRRAFYRCEKMQTLDCELDFTGQTDTTQMLTNCFMLRGLRIKPFTLTCSLNVGACKYFVHPTIPDDSLISLLNAIPNDREENADITITYSSEMWNFETQGNDSNIPAEFTSRTVYYNPETGLYSWDKQTENSETTSLYEAFVDRKGVTLAQ